MKSLCLVLVFVLLLISSSSNAQISLGVEGGAVVSSIVTTTPVPSSPFTPRIGARGGLFFENGFNSFFAIRTGVFYTLKGGTSNIKGDPYSTWNIHALTIPILATFTPIKPIRLGIGIETSIHFASESIVKIPVFGIGARTEIAWQISKQFRLIGHFTYDFTTILDINHTDINGNINRDNPEHYTCIGGGLSLAYTIKTFEKKEKSLSFH